jgi:hypothetical protein
MRQKFARSSLAERTMPCKRRAAKGIGAALLAASACGPVQAEVGSGLPPDGGAGDAPCAARAPLRLYLWNAHPTSTTNGIDYLVKVENAGSAAVPLAGLEVRYYFTNELAPPTTISIFYADTCCSNKIMLSDKVMTSLSTMPPKPNADSYLAIAFDPSLGDLAAGDDVQVELGFHDPQFARDLTQTNDYSYVTSATATQAEWDTCPGPSCPGRLSTCAITVYENNALVWGVPP